MKKKPNCCSADSYMIENFEKKYCLMMFIMLPAHVYYRREDYMSHMAVKPLSLPPVEHKDDPNTLIPMAPKLTVCYFY